MKEVVQTTKCAEDRPERCIVDQETYLYIRDEVFSRDIKERFIIPNHEEFYLKIANCTDPVERSNLWYEYKKLLSKYYPKYLKTRKNYYYRNGNIYHFRMSYGEIEILLLENKEITDLLNYYHEQQKGRLSLFTFLEELYTIFKTMIVELISIFKGIPPHPNNTIDNETYNKLRSIFHSGIY